MIGYGDRARTQCEVVRLFRETHPDLPPLNQGTISKIEAQYREMGHVRKVPSKRQAVVDDDTKLNLLLALKENPITPARQLARDKQLLPNIPPKSVIVMDNAPYHSRILNKIPNITTKKEDILKFMRNKNMNIPEKIPVMRKLFELIKEQNFKNEYVIDHLASIHGHNVTRLPPYYCVFNPIEMVWAAVKDCLRKYNQSPTLSASVVDNVRKITDELDNTELWRKCVRSVINKEAEYPRLLSVNSVIIQLNNSESESESESESASECE
ncbi:hypothetical protein NQ318_011081 [Aromia moschata]|uniref:Tc1-like transposase DDE domain-containing protein n=1 Tax=Aromia moschata TaxID=1265417 RepID=A0AAV8YSD5_9CUCU|nr:hypothetical protein NQ318_011081 [Aromia moschata]